MFKLEEEVIIGILIYDQKVRKTEFNHVNRLKEGSIINEILR